MLKAYCDECEAIILTVTQGSVYHPMVRVEGYMIQGDYCSLDCAVANLNKRIDQLRARGYVKEAE